jgi:tRNA 2-selenouridine synthase
MSVSLPVETFLTKTPHIPLLDVRSPGEFEQGHIPGAVNLPLFSDEERVKVGTLYKHSGKDVAFLTGLDIVGPKMSGFVKQARKVAPGGEVLVHCWRGGMRSSSMAWLLQTAGLQVKGILQKGYKAYRQEVLQFFERPLKLMILGGKTGSGKTNILQELARQREQIIDLEAIAHHKGSSFGSIGQGAQPTIEQFENNLHAAFLQLDLSRRIWLEDESRHIGLVRIPNPLFEQMRQAPLLFIEVPYYQRVDNLVQVYSHCDHRQLEEGLLKIRKRLGGLHFSKALEALDAGSYAEVAALTLNYYDKAYVFGLAKRPPASIHKLELSGTAMTANANQLIQTANQLTQAIEQEG